MELVFKQLVDAYTSNLQDTLRNFSVGPDFLDTWVHDEDLTKSIFGIFDAAEVASLQEPLAVVLDKATAAQLDSKWLLLQLGELGSVTVSEGPDSVKYQVHFKPKQEARKSTVAQSKKQEARGPKTHTESFTPAQSVGVSFDTAAGPVHTHPIYRAGLIRAAKQIRHQGKIADAYESQAEDAHLYLSVSANGTIQSAKHDGGSPLLRLLLDRFCAIVTGIPLQEAAEHGGLRTEYQLRDPEADRPVKGIAQSSNVEPSFQVLEKLARTIHRSWLQKTGQKAERNFWTDPVPAHWYQLSLEARISRIQSHLDEACLELGVQPIHVRDLKNEVRAVIEDEQKPGYPPFHLSLLKLESILKQKLGFSVELLLEDRADKNKRQLSRTEETEITLN